MSASEINMLRLEKFLYICFQPHLLIQNRIRIYSTQHISLPSIQSSFQPNSCQLHVKKWQTNWSLMHYQYLTFTDKWTEKQVEYLKLRLGKILMNKGQVTTAEVKKVKAEMPRLFRFRTWEEIQVRFLCFNLY